ncbi:hypothetical protein B0H63DRAFT_492189 [Podospora didyma]|uniref:Heterokaryon incompatibility domain-containing protein n=1 Tax=Podospora didyma TaxID=330526 RepID=A0AAE0P8E5_9PEZI|nr:hypothetical protein B0H63DRAFT_492189 [Podospora didyma]
MANVYKFAWLNIAALSTGSDYEGFINEAREPRAIFGFRASFAAIIGTGSQDINRNLQGRPCVLLDGEVTLLWDKQSDLPGGGDWMAPLFTRAWVYQERSLARRTLAFATHGVFFSCDEAYYGRTSTFCAVAAALVDEALATGNAPSREQLQMEARDLLSRFDATWNGAVIDYTKCKLTKDTDRLVAISSTAHEVADSGIPREKRYLAGLWDINFISQLRWMTCEGRNTKPRKRIGTDGYVAPSWSWASIEAPVATCGAFYTDDKPIRFLADVTAADVKLATEFPFGAVRAGWVRLRGCLRAVSGSETHGTMGGTSLTDEATGENLWFASDTTEGYEMVASSAGLRKVVWVPHVLTALETMVECNVLVLSELSPDEETGDDDGTFIKPGEKVYRRLGMGNFGRIPSLFRQDKLLMAMGTYPEADEMEDIAREFVRNEVGFREFVII